MMPTEDDSSGDALALQLRLRRPASVFLAGNPPRAPISLATDAPAPLTGTTPREHTRVGDADEYDDDDAREVPDARADAGGAIARAAPDSFTANILDTHERKRREALTHPARGSS